MLRTLIEKEILNNLRNARFSLAYVLCSVLVIGSAAILLSDHVTDRKTYDVGMGIHQRRLEEANGNYDFLFHNKVVDRPPLVTRVFALGGEKDADPRAAVTPEFSPYFFGDYKRNPMSNLFPSVDMVFIVGAIVGLLVFMLCYDSISGEREDGTLRLLLCGPIPRDTVLLAKWLGGYITLLMPFAISAGVVLLMLLFTPGVSATAGDWVRIGAVLALCALYIAAVFSLSMAVSVMVRGSGTGALALLLAWVVMVVMIPGLSAPLAQRIVSPPAPYLFEIAVNRIGIISQNDHTREHEKIWIARIGHTRWYDATREQLDDVLTATQPLRMKHFHEMASQMSVEGRTVSRAQERVDRLGRWFARLSPYGCLQNACVAVAGTGYAHELALRQSVEDYGLATTAYVEDFIAQGGKGQDLRAVGAPRYRFVRSSVGADLLEGFLDAGLLVLMTILFFMAAYLKFLRMDAS